MCLQRYGRLSLRPAAVFLRGVAGKVAEALVELGLVASHYDGYAQGKAGVLDSMLIPGHSGSGDADISQAHKPTMKVVLVFH